MSNQIRTLIVVSNGPANKPVTRRQRLLALQELSEFLFSKSLRESLMMNHTGSSRDSKDFQQSCIDDTIGSSEGIGRITPPRDWLLANEDNLIHQAALSLWNLLLQTGRFRRRRGYSTIEDSLIVALVVVGVIPLDHVLEVLEPIAKAVNLR